MVNENQCRSLTGYFQITQTLTSESRSSIRHCSRWLTYTSEQNPQRSYFYRDLGEIDKKQQT